MWQGLKPIHSVGFIGLTGSQAVVTKLWTREFSATVSQAMVTKRAIVQGWKKMGAWIEKVIGGALQKK